MHSLSPSKKFLEGLAATTVVVIVSGLLVLGVFAFQAWQGDPPVAEPAPLVVPEPTRVSNGVQERLKGIEAKRAAEAEEPEPAAP